MNHKIANILKSYIEELSWIDKIAGLTQTLRVNIVDGDTKVEKRVPVSCDISFDNCRQGCYDELIPNSAYRSIIYFEDQGVNLIKSEGRKRFYESRLRLVGWLNYTKLPGGCGNSGDFVIDIIKAFPAIPTTIDDMIGMMIEVTSQATRSNSIFGAYTYNEFQTQYLMLPYDYFALDIRTQFYIITECIEPEAEGCLEC